MAAIPPLKILKASAGSGKTFSLTAHYLMLLFAGDRKYREILAVTFTNKATAEMKGRILTVLEALATGDASAADGASGYREILLEAYPLWNASALRQQAAQVYRNILHDYSRFAVSTIDGFTQKVIRGFTFELGIDAGYKLEMNIRKVKADLVSRLNRLLDERPDLLQWIMDYAQRRIEQNESWNYRGALGDLASEIFKEDFQDFDRAVAGLPEQELFASLDSYCKAAIRGFEDTFETQLKAAAEVFATSGVTAADLNRKSQNWLGKLVNLSAQNPHDTIQKLEKYIDAPDEWQKGGLDGQVGALYRALNPLLAGLAQLYAQEGPDYYLAKAIDDNLYYLRLLKEMSVLLGEWRHDNAAQLISDAQLLLNHIGTNEMGDPTFIWEKMGNRFRHFLFDEFQDTSRKQWENLRPLLINAMGNASGNRVEHLIVGDVKQSIYRWRNGDWRILLDRAERQIGEAFNTTDTASLVGNETLEINYRSLERIVSFNNTLFAHAPGWLQESLNARVRADLGDEQYNGWWMASGYHDTITRAYADSQQRLPTAKPKTGGTVEVAFIPVEHNNHRPSAVKAEALYRMADALIGWIQAGTYRPGQVGILVRTNNEAREVIQFLLDSQREAGIAFDVISGDALVLVNQPAIRLLVDTLRVLAGRPGDVALYQANCVYLYHRIADRPLPADDWLRIAHARPQQLAGLLPESLCLQWADWAQLPLAELTEALIHAYGLQIHAESLPYLLAFRDLVAVFTATGERGIPAFLTYWEEEGMDRALPATADTNAVEVLTIHKSKGLAFDVVMIPFCGWSLDGKANGNFWVDTQDTPYALLGKVPVKYKNDLAKSSLFKAYFEEMLFSYMDALNTLYVATTRTRRHLYITAPGKKGEEPVKSLIAGDLLMEVLAGPGSDFADAAAHVPEATLQPPPATDGAWSFDHYLGTQRIQEELARPEQVAELDVVRLDAAKRQGQLLHQLMAAPITGEQDIAQQVEALYRRGLCLAEERDEVHRIALATWNHPALQALFAKGYAHRDERDIILPTGRTLRPDKVLVGPGETIVLDFKFTQHEDEAHLKQVVDYQLLLREMGMPDVKGYVFYGELGKLVTA